MRGEFSAGATLGGLVGAGLVATVGAGAAGMVTVGFTAAAEFGEVVLDDAGCEATFGLGEALVFFVATGFDFFSFTSLALRATRAPATVEVAAGPLAFMKPG